MAKAIEWERSTPRDEVIARFTASSTSASVLKDRGPEVLEERRCPSKGAISDQDFTHWSAWLNDTGIVTGDITPSKYYTNDFNDLLKGAAP